jgi:hypothetical protein
MLDQKQINALKADALKILSPIKCADDTTSAPKDFLFTAKRSEWSSKLPPYYLIYFLFDDLLKFKNLGQFEKLAWSFPIDYEGKAFLIEHRKFDVGVFINDISDEPAAKIIATKINGAVKKIRPFFSHIAEQAVLSSELNVVNNNRSLYSRYAYLRKLYNAEIKKYIKYKDVIKRKEYFDENGDFVSGSYGYVGSQYRASSEWLAISCIEAFYSWTEHLFIHLAIIAQGLADGKEIADLIEAEWKEKFVRALPLINPEVKKMHDELLIVRQQLRNFVAHGAFGKNGNAFRFHSPAGAVPVLFNHDKSLNRFSLTGSLSFDNQTVMIFLDNFIKYLWNGPMKLAMVYTQKWDFPTILTYAKKGKYKLAMSNAKEMKKLMDYLGHIMDQSANMDW